MTRMSECLDHLVDEFMILCQSSVFLKSGHCHSCSDDEDTTMDISIAMGKFGYLSAGDGVKGGNLLARLWGRRLAGAKVVATVVVWCNGDWGKGGSGGQPKQKWWATRENFDPCRQGRGVGCV